MSQFEKENHKNQRPSITGSPSSKNAATDDKKDVNLIKNVTPSLLLLSHLLMFL